jgi:hypothetical protein
MAVLVGVVDVETYFLLSDQLWVRRSCAVPEELYELFQLKIRVFFSDDLQLVEEPHLDWFVLNTSHATNLILRRKVEVVFHKLKLD